MPSKHLLSIALLQIAACGGGASTPSAVPTTSVVTAPSSTPAPQTTVAITTTSSTTTTTTTPLEVLTKEGVRSCPGWMPLARKVGWPEDQLERLSFVLWRESRCLPGTHNKVDPVSGSRGLAQINGYWCRPNKWTANGWLQDRGILTICDDLFEPEVNLRAALFIWFYGVLKGNSGWGPWSL